MTAPKPGTRGRYYALKETGGPGKHTQDFIVKRVEGSMCYAYYVPIGSDLSPDQASGADHASTFIWKFKDGLNDLHWWPGKNELEFTNGG